MSTRSGSSGKKFFRSTFTYFIPTPPRRKNGYREVEFDKIMRGLSESGFELESLQTESTDNGIFIVALLKTQNKTIFKLDSKLDLQEKFKLTHEHSSKDIYFDEDQDD